MVIYCNPASRLSVAKCNSEIERHQQTSNLGLLCSLALLFVTSTAISTNCIYSFASIGRFNSSLRDFCLFAYVTPIPSSAAERLSVLKRCMHSYSDR